MQASLTTIHALMKTMMTMTYPVGSSLPPATLYAISPVNIFFWRAANFNRNNAFRNNSLRKSGGCWVKLGDCCHDVVWDALMTCHDHGCAIGKEQRDFARFDVFGDSRT